MISKWIKRLLTRMAAEDAPIGYGVQFTGVLPTWSQSELEVVEITLGPPVEDDVSWLGHNPEGSQQPHKI